MHVHRDIRRHPPCLLLLLSLLLTLLQGSVEAATRARHQGDNYRHDDAHFRKHDSYKQDPYTQDDPYTREDPYAAEDDSYSQDDSYHQPESYEEEDPYKKDDVYQKDGDLYQKNEIYRPDELYRRPLPVPPANVQHEPLNLAPPPLPNPIRIDFTNATSLSAFEKLKARGTYLLGRKPHGFLQPPRTWTAGPKLDFDDTTTRDPAIPENPEGLKNPSLLVGPWEEEPTVRITNAVFKGVNGSVVEAQSGTTAKIPCVIMNRADHETVSWIRLRDHHLITVGRQTYTNDERFSVTYNRHLNEWVLHLRYAQHRDAGEYVCQLSTHPPMVFISTLTITQASSEIAGGPERYVQEGSSVVLNCTLRQHTQAPEYVFWYHNRTMINYVTDREVSVRNTGDGSILTLAAVGRTDSGNYTCLPPNSRAASITLHIIAGTPAAMQVSGSRQDQRPNQHLLLLLLLLVLALSLKHSS